MQYYFKVCHNCSVRGHFGSDMSRRTKLMGHRETTLMVVTGWTKMTRSDMAGFWTLRIREVTDIGTILVLVWIGIIIIIVIILTGGVIGYTFHMILRKQSHLYLMER